MARKIEPNLPQVATSSQLPVHLQNQSVVGVDSLKEFMFVPRVKIIQKQSDRDTVAAYKMGTTIITPNGVVIMEEDGVATIVPMFFFVDWSIMTDNKLRGKEPMIRYNTQDPNDPIVALCRDPKARVADDPQNPGMNIKYVETLNYVVRFVDHPSFNDFAVLGFSRGSHSNGRQFSNLIRARAASIFAGRYELRATSKKNAQGDWYSPLVTNPSENSWVSEEDYNAYAKNYSTLQEMFTAGRVKVVGDADDAPEEGRADM